VKNRAFFLFVLVFFLSEFARADEGMWLINLIGRDNLKIMKEKGFVLSENDIYHINKASLKDAVVGIDNFSCTGEIVSSKGLMLTNHHCAFDDIQTLSSLENNYLENGFWANSIQDEIPIPGKTISFLIKVEDFTKEVKDSIKVIKREGRVQNSFWKRKLYHQLESRIRRESGLQVSLVNMFHGKQYLMYYYEQYQDVRLVGAPPSSIAAFGGDTDNWMWPQHKADFAIYRIYTGKNGEPADYSDNNIPLKPKKYLKLSVKGYAEGDFAMVLGYPANTSRIIPAAGVERHRNLINPSLIQVRENKLSIIKKGMKQSDTLRIKYASKYFSESNYYKYAIGQNKYLDFFEIIDKRKEEDEKLKLWIEKTKLRKAKYGNLINEILALYKEEDLFFKSEIYYINSIMRGAQLMPFVLRQGSLERLLNGSDSSRIKRKKEALKRNCSRFYENFDIDIDQEIFAKSIELYCENTEKEFFPKYASDLIEKYQWDYSRLSKSLYCNSPYKDSITFRNYIDNITLKQLDRDTLLQFHSSILNEIYRLRQLKNPIRDRRYELLDLYNEAMFEYKGGDIYPDANSTMRLSYGETGGYSPADGITYNYYTTTKGILEKEVAGDFEFDLLPEYKKLLLKAEFGKYADASGNLRVNFITDNDITGGNSGSPVLNSRGELIGLAFDGNWESMAGDFYYVEDFTKSVCLDIRYLLFIIENYSEATYLLDEMEIAQ